MREVRLTHPEHATPAEAARVLGDLFPVAGSYVLEHDQGARRVTLSAPAGEAADPLTLWHALFPDAGRYLLKAVGPEGQRFTEWFLERLVAEAQTRFASVQDLVRRTVEAFIAEHGGDLTAAAAVARFEGLLFDLRLGIRWSLATPLAPEVEARLRALGFGDRELMDVPGIAYRLGMIDQDLRAPGVTFTWTEVLRRAAEVPLSRSDEAAIAVARQRMGSYLTPVLLRDGTALELAAAARERDMLRTMGAEAVRAEMHPREFARQLYKNLELGQGIVRDWDRVARTEIQEVRCQGAFQADARARAWTAETLIYRVLAAVPCNGCIRLYLGADGQPRRYPVAEVEAADAQGPNRGPWREWVPKIGPTHPNCLCSPWLTWSPALEGVFARRAAQWRDTLTARGLEAAT